MSEANINEVVERFIRLAIEYGENIEKSTKKSVEKGNQAADEMMKMGKEIAKQPDQGKELLSELVSHGNLSVRIAAAVRLLPLDEMLAVRTLEEAEKEPGFLGLNAELILKEWRKNHMEN